LLANVISAHEARLGGAEMSKPAERNLHMVGRLIGALALACASSLHAAPIIGLTQGASSLITFDTATPGTTTAPVAVTGLGAGETLVGIDFRPQTGQLYGLGSGNNLYTLNATTGAATLVGPLTTAGATPVPLNGTSFGVDFNPLVDRLRIVSDANQNLRANPSNAVTIVDGTLNPGDPNVVGAAYTNNFLGGSLSTTLFVLDSALDDLQIQSPPNAGTLTSVGDLGVDFDDMTGFDIFGASSAFASLNTGGPATGFYSIDLATGAASLIGDIGGGLLLADIALPFAEPVAVPAPGTLALLLGALAAFAWTRSGRSFSANPGE
jgi:hypothetical protein